MAFTALGMLVPLVLAIFVYIGYVWIGIANGSARTTGVIAGLGLHAPVTVIRDARGVPHIRAASIHDAAFAQGYVTGRRPGSSRSTSRGASCWARSPEMLGSVTMQADENARIIDLKRIVDNEYAHLSAVDRDTLQAYADGVNAARRARIAAAGISRAPVSLHAVAPAGFARRRFRNRARLERFVV